MIVDELRNATLYDGLGEPFVRAMQYFQSHDLSHLEPGKHPVEGEEFFILVQKFTTKPHEEGIWEAHKKFLDVHCMLDGIEKIGYTNTCNLEPVDYNTATDFITLEGKDGEGDFVTGKPGNFVVMFLEDAHMPGILIDYPIPIHKIVLKVPAK